MFWAGRLPWFSVQLLDLGPNIEQFPSTLDTPPTSGLVWMQQE